MTKAKKLSPMYKQYKKLKATHPNALLLYRLGDFYELFEDDAEIGSRELGLTLTSRRFSKDVRLPMAGFPHRYINSYIARFIKKGYMVAVADQLEDARQAKGLVKRGVVRVVTSGTVMEQPLLKETRDNFLLAIAPSAQPSNQETGLAFIDISTGDFNCTQLSQAALLEEISHINPSEVILPPVLMTDETFCQLLTQLGVARLSPLPADLFKLDSAQTTLQTHFQVASLEAYSTAPLGLIAAAAILHYLNSNHLANLAHITTLTTYHIPDYLALDTITRRNLELTHTLREGNTKGTLLSTLDKTKTRMGTRLLRRWITQPLCHLNRIKARLNTVEIFVNNAFTREDLRAVLHGLYDLERLAGRIGYGNANGRDLINLKNSLSRVPTVKTLLEKLSQTDSLFSKSRLPQLQTQLNPLTNIANLINGAIVEEPPILLKDGGLIKTDFNPELETLRQTAEAGRAWLTDYEAAERERTGIKNLKVKYNQVFGFFIEVTKSYLKQVPDNYERRSTISTGERFKTAELRSHEQKILNAEDAANSLEYTLFLQIRQTVSDYLPALRQTAQALAHLDVLTTFAEVAALYNYVKPHLTVDPTISLHESRHPVVEHLLSGDVPFVPNDCLQNEDQRLIVLTGPNMSGKSVYLRQVALAVLMAQMGSYVAATEAQIGLADRIFARAGASDDISQGRSTFLVEMSETAHILHHATERSLVILDEVGRGTSTYDGLSLAWAVAEDIHRTLNARCLFATHFHELTTLGDTLTGAANFSLAVRERDGEVIFLRQLIPGGADRSYGIHVARLAGLPKRVLEKAQHILKSLEAKSVTKSDESATYSIPAQPTLSLVEQQAPYQLNSTHNTAHPVGNTLLLPAQDEQVWHIINDLYQLDIANLTPFEALLRLNEWQQKLKKG